MLNRGLKQEATGGSTAVQAGGNVQITQNIGLSYSEVRDVVLDVFKTNFYQFSGLAAETARARAQEVTDNFLKKLKIENESGISKAQDPDFQHGLFTIQAEYAKTGDKDLGDLLVDLLVDRSKEEHRNMLQIVLNESIKTAPKLTNAQLGVLATIFLFRYVQFNAIGNHNQLGEYLDRYMHPFGSIIVRNQSCFQHLEFAGCGSIQMGEITLEGIFEKTYQGLFSKGFEENEIATREISIGNDKRFFAPCLNDSEKVQVRALNKESLTQNLKANNIASDDSSKIQDLFDCNMMSQMEIKKPALLLGLLWRLYSIHGQALQ